jgi:chemotaxis protein MotB
MARKHKHPEHVNHERWLVSYADFITLLFAFFVVMFAVSQVDTGKVGRFTQSFNEAQGIPIGGGIGSGILPGATEGKPEPKPGYMEPDKPGELEKLKGKLEQDKKESEDLAGIAIFRNKNELVLRLSDDVLFSSGDDKIKGRAVRALEAIVDEIKDRKVDLRVEGHTDDIPIKNARFRSNWDLSTARATAVIAELAAGGKLEPERLSAAGYGEFRPVADNGSPEGRAQNRRVDLVVTEQTARHVSPATPEGAKAEEPKAEKHEAEKADKAEKHEGEKAGVEKHPDGERTAKLMTPPSSEH